MGWGGLQLYLQSGLRDLYLPEIRAGRAPGHRSLGSHVMLSSGKGIKYCTLLVRNIFNLEICNVYVAPE